MSGWIKLEKDLLTDPRMMRLARFVSTSITMNSAEDPSEGFGSCNGQPLPGVIVVLGALAQLWMIADTHILDDDVLPLGVDEIDDLLGLPGFCGLIPEDWLQVIDSDHVKLPGYHKHNGTIAKERAQNQKRVEKSRNNATRTTVTACNGTPLPDLDQTKTYTKTKEIEEAADAAARVKAMLDEDEQGFEDFKALYPKRNGNQPWVKARRAISARLAEGSAWNDILAGASRYAAWCKATGKLDTETVMQAVTFCGPEKGFLKPWNLPATKADNRLAGNLSAAEEFMRRTEALS